MCCLLLFLPTPALALEVRIVQAPRVVFHDVPFELSVDLVDLDEDITGLELKADPAFRMHGPQSGGRRTEIVNGVRSQSLRVLWTITPPTTRGTYGLGPIELVTKSGKRQNVPLSSVKVVQRAQAGAQLLVTAPAGGPVGFPFVVRYTLLTARERFQERGGAFSLFDNNQTPFGLTGLELSLLGSDLPLEAVKPDPERPATELNVGRDHSLLVQEGIVEHEGLGYYGTRFALKVVPRRPGPIDLGAAARVKVRQGTRRVRDMFGRVQEVPAGQELNARAVAGYAVAELPTQGRPQGFSGAVGRFTIETACALTEANAYDPIEVTVTIRGDGLLDDLVLPAWQELDAIAASFQVATDVDPGTVSSDAKVFTKVFRARSADVKALPALPFPHYDPTTRSYQVAHSQPIPLTIRAVRTVTADDAVGAANQAARPVTGEAPAPIVAREGVAANYLDLGEVHATLAGRARLDALLLLALLVPPLALGGLTLQRVLAARAEGGAGALGEALAQLEADASLDGTRAALQEYFQGRLGTSPGELTPGELERALQARVVPPETLQRCVSFWEELARARFAGGGEVPSGAAELLRELEGCL